MPDWKIGLEGNNEALGSFSRLPFTEFDISVDNKVYCLTSEKLNKIADIEANRPPTQFIFPVGVPSLESVGGHEVISNGVSEQSKESGNSNILDKYMLIASGNENISIALQINGALEPNWKNLYLILEKISEDVGNFKELTDRRWISNDNLSRFKHTANSFRALGSNARHSNSKIEPPAKPMAIGEAQTLIRDLLDKWVKSK